jgi:hypothetical protein
MQLAVRRVRMVRPYTLEVTHLRSRDRLGAVRRLKDIGEVVDDHTWETAFSMELEVSERGEPVNMFTKMYCTRAK